MRNIPASSYDPHEKFSENIYHTNNGGPKMIWLPNVKT